jgi:hypothetical protein
VRSKEDPGHLLLNICINGSLEDSELTTGSRELRHLAQPTLLDLTTKLLMSLGDCLNEGVQGGSGRMQMR